MPKQGEAVVMMAAAMVAEAAGAAVAAMTVVAALAVVLAAGQEPGPVDARGRELGRAAEI